MNVRLFVFCPSLKHDLAANRCCLNGTCMTCGAPCCLSSGSRDSRPCRSSRTHTCISCMSCGRSLCSVWVVSTVRSLTVQRRKRTFSIRQPHRGPGHALVSSFSFFSLAASSLTFFPPSRPVRYSYSLQVSPPCHRLCLMQILCPHAQHLNSGPVDSGCSCPDPQPGAVHHRKSGRVER